MEKIYELWQRDKLFITGTKKELANFTGLSIYTIENYCRPGYFDDKPNETQIRIVDVSNKHNKSEADIQSEIMIELSKRGHKIFRSNAGKIKTEYGTYIKLFPKGFPDLCGYRKDDGKFIAIEVKNEKGRLRPEQIKFAEFAETQPILYGVARSADEAIHIVESD